MRSSVVRLGALVLVGLVLAGAVGPASASAGLEPDDEAARRAAEEIAAARDRANRAAEDFFAAESRLDQLELEQDQLRAEIDVLTERVDTLALAIEQLAVSRFVSSGSSGIPILTDLRGPTEQLHGDVLTEVVAETGASTIDDYDEARSALARKVGELEDNEAELEQQRDDLLDLQETAEAEVERLREIESQRLEDEAVRIALEARQREEARLQAELERRTAATLQVAVAGSSTGRTTGNVGASGGNAGGRTGAGGTGADPLAAGAGFIDAIICPVQGVSAYGDTWGAPRSGGRRHQGTDLLAPVGTPLQAVVSGTVTHKDSPLGGTTMSLLGDNGNRYYYAHLSAYEGVPGRVEQGQVIGYIGDSGNATGVPHLHFEIRPNGGVPVNPYASIRAAGC